MNRFSAVRWFLFLALTLAMGFQGGAVPANCQCRPTSAQTRWGVHEVVVMKQPKPPKSIHGTVADQTGKPLDDVLVEVYDSASNNRITGCITDETGVFALNVPPGHYELRLSKSSEWDTVTMPVRVQKSAADSKKGLVLWLQLGT